MLWPYSFSSDPGQARPSSCETAKTAGGYGLRADGPYGARTEEEAEVQQRTQAPAARRCKKDLRGAGGAGRSAGKTGQNWPSMLVALSCGWGGLGTQSMGGEAQFVNGCEWQASDTKKNMLLATG